VAFFSKHRAEIRTRFGEEFVSILDDKVIDHDVDYGALEERCRRTCPGKSPYLTYASALPLSDLLERFQIKVGPDEPLDREGWETAATEDALLDSDE
jgi:hypothetical protein